MLPVPGRRGSPGSLGWYVSVTERVLFTWVHLSDLHFGHGGAKGRVNQDVVLRLLRADLQKATTSWPELPKVDAIFVTGDVAFSGAVRSADEYQRAGDWLESLRKLLKVESTSVFLVPGNHDAQREGSDEAQRAFTVAKLRKDPNRLDEALVNPQEGQQLRERFANFAAFSERFGGGDLLGWRRAIDLPHGHRLVIYGLNSAVLAADDDDAGLLAVSERHLPPGDDVQAGDIVVVLSHHPVEGWWFNAASHQKALRQHAAIHLCGHVHEPNAIAEAISGGAEHLRIVAAASHAEATEALEPQSHGYNLASLVVGAGDAVYLRVWPRRWFDKWQEFRVDAFNVPDRRMWEERRLGIPSRPSSARLKEPAEGGVSGVAGWEEVSWPDVLRGARSLDVMAIAGATLFQADAGDRVRAILKAQGRVRVLLADPTDDEAMRRYDSDFDKSAGDRRHKVIEGLDVATKLAQEFPKGMEVRVTSRTFRYSAYCVDGEWLFVPYAMIPGKRPGSTPTFAFRPSGFVVENFLRPDMEALMNEARLVTLADVQSWRP